MPQLQSQDLGCITAVCLYSLISEAPTEIPHAPFHLTGSLVTSGLRMAGLLSSTLFILGTIVFEEQNVGLWVKCFHHKILSWQGYSIAH